MSGNGLGIPTGVIFDYSGDTAPAGWLICDGSPVSRTTYARLFQVIGTKYGSGDGSTTFNLPGQQGMFRRGNQMETDKTFAPADVNIGTDVITVLNHGIKFTGYRVRVSSTTTLPTGLVASTDYFVILVDANNIKLASSRANALAGTAIDITAIGSGTHSLLMWQDASASSRVAQTVGGTTGNNPGSMQTDSIQNLTGNFHTIAATGGTANGTADGVFQKNSAGTGNVATSGGAAVNNSFDASRQARTSTETRPANLSVNWIIKL